MSKESLTESRTVTSEGAKRAILKCFKKQRPVFLWGPPGIGKSEVVSGIADSLGAAFIDLRLHRWSPPTCVVFPTSTKSWAKWIGHRQSICPMRNLLANIRMWFCSWTK